jgi:hypothetical protein
MSSNFVSIIDNDTSTLHVRPTLIPGTNLLKPPLNPTTYDYRDPDAATTATLVGDSGDDD